MRIIAHYRVANRRQFERTVVPYIHGSGEYAAEVVASGQWHDDDVVLEVATATVSQLVTATVGMLRFAPGSTLERIEAIEVDPHRSRDLFPARPVVGVILKPALADITAHHALIERAVAEGMDFVKDDDVTECSAERIARIADICSDRIVYFRKISTLTPAANEPTMIVPWVDGWPLAERVAQTIGAPLLIHPANTPTTISWSAHITLARCIGAAAVVVPDAHFDPTADLDAMLRAAIATNGGIPTTRLLLAGGMTPVRIEEIKRTVDSDAHRHLGFTIGSWFIRHPSSKTESSR